MPASTTRPAFERCPSVRRTLKQRHLLHARMRPAADLVTLHPAPLPTPPYTSPPTATAHLHPTTPPPAPPLNPRLPQHQAHPATPEPSAMPSLHPASLRACRRLVCAAPRRPMSTPASEPARYKGPAEDEMTEGQRQVYDEICRNRTTGIKGPFGPWLANPVLADAAQTLGRVCRYETSFTLRESELAILMTAVHHKAPTEWAIHVGEARKAGMPEEVIAALEQGATPPGMSEREAAIHTMAKELLANSTVSAGAYGQAVRVLGDTATVELVSIVGYYTYVAYTLNAFQIQA